MELASHGMTEAETGVLLGVSEAAAADYMKYARWKLRAKTKAHAVALALRQGLIR